LHVHGLGAARWVTGLVTVTRGCPILLQDHADALPPFWQRRAWRRGFDAVAGVAFCSAEQARPFVANGVLPARIPVYPIPESTSRFTPGDALRARLAAGVYGSPLILWVGHLNENKDPLTVLEGFRRALEWLPAAHLWCCFGSAPLLAAIEQRLQGDPLLRARVHLTGRVSHEHVETLMRAADLFVLGSHHEGSGYALIEALACGLPPVVTDIPSFRTLTARGAVGMLWPPGDPESLSRALVSMAARTSAAARATVRSHYETELSFAAVGRKLVAAYEDLMRRAHDIRAERREGRS
jgi:glycosyltransferase involved in cell wall biosynthesis